MLCICVYMHSRFIKNHLIRILKDGLLISEEVLSQLMTPCFIITVECWVNHGCCVQHHLESLHVCINFFVVIWQVSNQ
jgi:hypothetical protein